MEIKNYTFWRIQRILKADYKIILRKKWIYKANRVKGYVERYDMILEEDNSLVLENVTLNAIRLILTLEGYSLHDEKSEV